jgi:hypothetical protein
MKAPFGCMCLTLTEITLQIPCKRTDKTSFLYNKTSTSILAEIREKTPCSETGEQLTEEMVSVTK